MYILTHFVHIVREDCIIIAEKIAGKNNIVNYCKKIMKTIEIAWRTIIGIVENSRTLYKVIFFNIKNIIIVSEIIITLTQRTPPN